MRQGIFKCSGTFIQRSWLGAAALLLLFTLLLLPSLAAADPTGSIAGKVTNAIGHAEIEGIEACALSSGDHETEGCASTDSSGNYVLTGLPVGSYDMGFFVYDDLNFLRQYYHGKNTLSEANSVSVTAGSITANIDAEMQPGAEITGKAVDAISKTGIEGVEACAEEIGGTETFECGETDGSGDYSIKHLAEGSYRVRFASNGSLNYLTEYYNGKSYESADTVSVTAGSTSPNIDAEMHKGGKVEGTVIDAVSKSPLEDVEVCAFLGSSEYSTRCASSESNGAYTLTNLASGSYEIKFKPQFNDHAHVKQFYDGKPSRATADPVSVTAGATTPDIDAELHEGGKISGVVTRAAGGAPIEGIFVCAIPTNYELSEYGSSCGSSDASGKYTISSLAGGGYRVQFSGGVGYQTQYYSGAATEAQASAVSVNGTATTQGIDAQLQAAGQIKGKITDAVTKAPLTGIEVCAIRLEIFGYQPSMCGYVQPGGEYTIGGLPPGSYKVRFSAGYGEISPGQYGQLNYVTQFYKGKATESQGEAVAVTAGAATQGIDAEMQTGGKISGTIVSAQGKAPLKGIEVCASPTNKRASPGSCGQTNSSGEYTILRLAGGSYRVKFQPGYENRNYLVQYYDGQATKKAANPVAVTVGLTTLGIDAELQPGGKISGEVVDALSKAGLSGISVCARYVCATTNSAGEYTIEGLSTGFYKVHFAPSYESANPNYADQYYDGKATSEAAEEVAVTAGSAISDVDAELHAGGKIAGTVLDASSKTPLQHVEACAYSGSDEEFGSSYCAQTDASGEYTIQGLSAGSYRVGFFPRHESGGGEPFNGNYLIQYYDEEADFESGDPVTVTLGATSPDIDAELHEGGRISGTVTGAPGAAPLHYAEVCAFAVGGAEEEFGTCASTDASGKYTIEGLPAGSYTVSFAMYTSGFEAQGNYLRQYYDDKAPGESATLVQVSVGATTPNIDAELHVGGQIKGRVVEASDNVPLQGVSACAIAAGSAEEFGDCASTNGNGEYVISGLSSGSYVVKFSAFNYEYEEGFPYEEVLPEEEFKTQFYNGKPTFAQANPVSVAAGAATTGINASMEEVASAAVKPVNTEAPLLSGAPVVGEGLSCSQGVWSGTPTNYTYRWLRDDVEISGKTGPSYTVQAADQGHALACRVTAGNSKGSTSADSNQLQVPAGGGGESQFGLVVSLAGSGAGAVTSSPAGIDCGAICSHSFPAGTSVLLTAAPASGSSFAGWSGSGCAGTGPCHVSLGEAASVTATFNAEPSGGGGGGGGSSSPGGGGSGGIVPSPILSGSPQPPKPRSLHCKRGFKKAKVKGKQRCVKGKKPKKRHRTAG